MSKIDAREKMEKLIWLQAKNIWILYFRKVQCDDDLDLKNKSSLNLYYLDISDSAFDYIALNEYLFDSVGMYVYSRTQMKAFKDKKKIWSMGG